MPPSPMLEFLLVSANYQTVTAVAAGLEQVGARCNFAPTREAGQDYVGRRRVDGVIVDLDVPGAQDLILAIRQGPSNRGVVVFACPPSGNASPVALVAGASYLLARPLTPESVAAHVSAAQSSMIQEKRRFFRYSLRMPVHLTSNGREQRAMMTSLGEGGMAAHAVEHIDRPQMVEFAFDLPAAGSVAGKGSVVWANDEGMHGIKFLFLREPGEKALKDWIGQRQGESPTST